jgi:hypothetical protein
MRLGRGKLDLNTKFWCGNLLGYDHLETAKEMKNEHDAKY